MTAATGRTWLTVVTVAGHEDRPETVEERSQHERERRALVEATQATLETFAVLGAVYDDTLARGDQILGDVDDTLRKVRELLKETE